MPANQEQFRYPSRKGKPELITWLLAKLLMNKINLFLANWKTTLAGVAAICVALQDGFQMADVAAITTAIGLIVSKDADKSNAQFPVKATKV